MSYKEAERSPISSPVRTRRELGRAVLAACVAMFAEGFCGTMFFPFASFMVEDLRGTDAALGLYTGLFFTAFPIGSLLTARMWGAQANCIGRRACLLLSVTFGIIFTFSMAFCTSYEVLVLLRFTQGLLNCTLPMARTCLRERVDQLKGDEVQSFSYVQTAFAAAAVIGPSAGGFLYGYPSKSSFLPPWAVPNFAASILFAAAFIFTSAFMVETADLEVESTERCRQNKEVALFGDVSMIYFLIMVAGHSFVFTGWEVGYPLIARNADLEGWSSARIGMTFLVGSVFLLLHTLFTYPKLVKTVGLDAVWSWSWMGCVVVLFAFPRVLKLMLAMGFSGESLVIIVVNYVSQFFISVLQGCNFTTLQLMINGLISARGNREYALPLANGWMVALQSLARSIAPVMTGSLVANSSPYYGVVAFDILAVVALVCCWFVGRSLQKSVQKTACAMEKAQGNGDVTNAYGYRELKDADCKSDIISQSKPGSSNLIGYSLTVVLAGIAATTTLFTGIASKSIALPGYTENLGRCLTASITMSIICVVTGTKMIHDAATMRSACWLAIADWFFLWGYVKCMAYFDTTQFSATSVSMTPMVALILGFFILSEPVSIAKMAGMVRNIVVVILVIDPFGFFSVKTSGNTMSSSGSDKSSSGSNLVIGFVWCLVACLGSVFMRIVQRQLTHAPSAMTSFWCFAINTILWFPPGSIPPEVRVQGLWPSTPEDAIGFDKVPLLVWACTAASGFLGALMITGQAVTLTYIDVGTYSNLLQPLNLVFSFIVDVLTQPAPQPPRVVLGVLLAVIGIAVEGFVSEWLNRQPAKTAG